MKKKLLCVALCLSLVFSWSNLVLNTKKVEAKTRINHNKLTVYVGQEKTLKIKGKNSWGFTWKRSNKKVKILDCGKYCYVTGKKVGKCTLTARNGKRKVKCKVTIKRRPVNNVVQKPKITIDVAVTWPFYVTEFYGSSVHQKIRITGWYYRIGEFDDNNRADITFGIKGRKVTGSKTLSESAMISYKLYRANGTVYDDNCFITPSMILGESFEKLEDTMYNVPAGHYKMVILNTMY